MRRMSFGSAIDPSRIIAMLRIILRTFAREVYPGVTLARDHHSFAAGTGVGAVAPVIRQVGAAKEIIVSAIGDYPG
jgi:hypothetical protein